MTRREKDWLSFMWFAARLAWLILLAAGCAAARETAKADWQLTRDFTACDAEAKAIARTAPACSVAVAQLLDLMQQPECQGFNSAPADGGITIGGVTYICHEEVPRGK
jgi:hypothetical protein